MKKTNVIWNYAKWTIGPEHADFPEEQRNTRNTNWITIKKKMGNQCWPAGEAFNEKGSGWGPNQTGWLWIAGLIQC